MEKNFTTLGPYVLPVGEQVRDLGSISRIALSPPTIFYGLYLCVSFICFTAYFVFSVEFSIDSFRLFQLFILFYYLAYRFLNFVYV